jgi:hypothetical protein
MLHDSAGQEVTRVISRASSTLEGGIPCKSIDPDLPAPMDMAKVSSALEVAAAEGPALEGGAGSDPAPEGVGAGPSLLLLWMSTLNLLQSGPRRLW